MVIWAADTNYRIDMENEQVRSLAANDNLQSLLQEDQVRRHHAAELDMTNELFSGQLIHAMNTNAAFSSYKEEAITFSPTYRYDLHSNKYDTSEKQRIPAWTGLYCWPRSMHQV